MPELAVADRIHEVAGADVLALGQNLSADVVDAGPVLSGQTAEIVAEARTGAGVLVIVLDQMADVLHAVRAAPVTDLEGEAVLHLQGDSVHVIAAHHGLQIFVKILLPDQRQEAAIVRAPFCLKTRADRVGPRLVVELTDLLLKLIQMAVADLRLVREEARDRLAEFCAVMGKMRLIDGFDQLMAGCFVHHVDVIPVRAAVPGQMHDGDLPALRILRRRRKRNHAVFCRVRQVDQLRAVPAFPDRCDADQPVVVESPHF